MIANFLPRPARAVLLALAVTVSTVSAQAQAPAPSANAIALAKEIIIVKGSSPVFESVGPAVIEKAKSLFLQTSPMLSKDLNDVGARSAYDVAVAQADGDHSVAIQQCLAMTGAKQKSCKERADAGYDQAKTQANVTRLSKLQ